MTWNQVWEGKSLTSSQILPTRSWRFLPWWRSDVEVPSLVLTLASDLSWTRSLSRNHICKTIFHQGNLYFFFLNENVFSYCLGTIFLVLLPDGIWFFSLGFGVFLNVVVVGFTSLLSYLHPTPFIFDDKNCQLKGYGATLWKRIEVKGKDQLKSLFPSWKHLCNLILSPHPGINDLPTRSCGWGWSTKERHISYCPD